MSKRSCAAAESIEDASLRMARVNGRQMQKRSARIALIFCTGQYLFLYSVHLE